MCARKGLGVLGFSVGDIAAMAPVLEAYKSEIGNAEPVGAYVNDNLMVTTVAFVAADEQTARQSALASSLSYLQSNVYRYHDTFPHPVGVPYWPDLLPDITPEMLDFAIAGGMILGDPDQALEQCQRWESAGADQLVFALGSGDKASTLQTIRLLGEEVIPKLDPDPVHRTTRFREAAAG